MQGGFSHYLCSHSSWFCLMNRCWLLLQVVCTLGPKSRSVEMLEELLRAGMSVARFNFSHGSHDYHQARKCVCSLATDPMTWCRLPGGPVF